MQFTHPIPFTEAVQKLGVRTPIGSTLSSPEWSALSVGLRERAFWSARIEDVRLLQDMHQAMGDFLDGAREKLPSGETVIKIGSRADFVALMQRMAREYGVGPVDPRDEGTIKDVTSRRRLALIFDINVKAARDYGDWLQGMDPDVLDAFPAQRFIRSVDVTKPRKLHEENENAVRLKTDLKFWLKMNSRDLGGFDVPWGPWGFNSGMDVEDVDRAEAEDLDLIGHLETAKPIVEDFNTQLSASVRGLDPHLLSWAQEQFGDQVEVQDGTMWWGGNKSSHRLAMPDSRPAPQAPPVLDLTPEPPVAAPPPLPSRAPAASPPVPRRVPTNPQELTLVRHLPGIPDADLVIDRQGHHWLRISDLAFQPFVDEVLRELHLPPTPPVVVEGPEGSLYLTPISLHDIPR